MSAIPRVVSPFSWHKDSQEGGAEMQSETIKSGNTTVIIHSKLAGLSIEERRQFLEKEWSKQNPVLLNIAKVVSESVSNYS